MTDLFTWRESFPNRPGFKKRGTSQRAAREIATRAPSTKARCLQALRNHGPMTADDVAAAIGVSEWNVRPRITELKCAGLIEVCGEGKSCNGKPAEKWRAL